MEILDGLKGFKTYIVSAIIIAGAIAEGLLGWDIPGVDLKAHWVEAIMTALGLSALRGGIAKVEPPQQ